jgi:hypothetical protein
MDRVQADVEDVPAAQTPALFREIAQIGRKRQAEHLLRRAS